MPLANTSWQSLLGLALPACDLVRMHGVLGRDRLDRAVAAQRLRVGSARELAADGASLVELQQAGGWRSPTTPAVYVRREVRHARPGRPSAVRGRPVGLPAFTERESTFVHDRRICPAIGLTTRLQ